MDDSSIISAQPVSHETSYQPVSQLLHSRIFGHPLQLLGDEVAIE
jgi:hypothetical protein